MAKVYVDRRKCQGLGLCESIAPQVFEVTEDGVLSLPTEGTFVETDRELIISAVEGCPNEALSISEE
ncbi:ferredoxin [Rhodococcus sp. 2H158]|uniref:ferredoxin n=1 Tax=Rhodococcus aetherivorans TaxID=191292 RepID=UPI0009C55A29|nr:hypothetical protein GQ85_00860 [Rhodococcus rhodochrous]